MKRSESMLVYAVTAVLVVIVLVAVLFGGDPEAVLADQKAEQGEGIDVLKMLSDTDDERVDVGSGADNPGGGALANGVDLDPEPVTPTEPEAVPLETVLGPFHEERMGDRRFRVVAVRRGDSFSEIVERWTGSLRRSDEVRALNEHLDFDYLLPGQEVCLPWVDDAILRAAAVERRPLRRDVGFESALRADARLANGNDSVGTAARPATPPVVERGADGVEYVVKDGESLWQIAAARVGRGAATAYVQRIVDANASITDGSRVREGQKILLPAR